ncbi:zinc finger BED domain-containing protein RICESLEEPER 1-like [Canna indica]|uniref:Zinc finger BED domain-containing protein RICESLEEPER 1-like n=1 Tax=Canna indica TaxID=4628 RepID=A0AAQ3QCJ1_9LILI|nr:zinc finger BED domain-containing protein RICESLEEPER 1-like [Canna indica]
MPSPHTGVALTDKIYDVLNDWGIVEKLSSLTLDNSSTNDIYHNLIIECISEDEPMRRMATRMMGKFEKYWSNFNETLAIAVVLDPWFKFEFMEWGYKKIYGSDAKPYIEAIRRTLFSLIDEYVQRSSSTLGSSSVASQMNFMSQESERKLQAEVEDETFYGNFDITGEMDGELQKSELDAYLDEKRIKRTEKLDILSYWAKHHHRYPILGSIARDFLCIPITTVASESAFSCSGRIIDRFRNLVEAIAEFQEYTEDILNPNEANNLSMQGSNVVL